jgi:hypothetical protein
LSPFVALAGKLGPDTKKDPKNNKILGTVSGKIKGELAQQIRGPSESRGPTGKGQTKFGTF